MWGMTAIDDDDRLDADAARQVIRRAARMAAPFRRTMLGALAFSTITTLGLLLGPVIVRYGIDRGIRRFDGDVVRNAVVLYIVVVVAAYLASRQQYVFINRAGEGFLRLLRIRVFGHIQKQSLSFFDRNKSGVLVARMTADIESMAELVQWGLLQFVGAGLLVTLSFGLLLVLSWQLTIVALLVFPVLVVASRKFQRDSNAAYLDVREQVGQNLSTLQEGVAGVRVIQAYAREPEQIRRFEASNRALYRSHMHSLRVSTWFFGLVEAAGVIASALAIGIGGWLVDHEDVTIGTVIAVVLLLAQLFEPVQQLSQLYNTVQSSAASLSKLFDILDTTPDLLDGAQILPAVGAVTVAGVGFRYPDTAAPVLDDVSITVADGERLAVVGSTGSGKSTLAKLMARLYDPTTGTITFGGVDLRDATLASLRERVVVVPQEGYLFGGTHCRQRARRPCRRHRRRGPVGVGRHRCARTVRRVRRRHPHRGTRARVTVVGRGAAVGGARPSRAGRSGRARARRGDEQPRPRHRSNRRARPRVADARPDHDRGGPPTLDDPSSRPDCRDRRRPSGRTGHP